MERRTFLTLLAGAPALSLLASCGSDDVAAPGAPLPSVPDPTAPSDGTSQHFRLEIGYYGGFTTREVSFQMQPALLVTPDRQVLQPGAVAAIYPGPLLPTDFTRSITAEGFDRLIVATRDAGMLADVTYEGDQRIADASTATLLIELDGAIYRHEAYALGGGGVPGESSEDSPERQAFARFAEQLADLSGLVGAENLGPEEPYVPDAYQLIAFPAGDLSGYEIEPTIVEWPASTGIVLSELTDCVEVPRADVGALFDTSTQLTFFSEGNETYSVVPRPAYPGRSCP